MGPRGGGHLDRMEPMQRDTSAKIIGGATEESKGQQDRTLWVKISPTS